MSTACRHSFSVSRLPVPLLWKSARPCAGGRAWRVPPACAHIVLRWKRIDRGCRHTLPAVTIATLTPVRMPGRAPSSAATGGAASSRSFKLRARLDCLSSPARAVAHQIGVRCSDSLSARSSRNLHQQRSPQTAAMHRRWRSSARPASRRGIVGVDLDVERQPPRAARSIARADGWAHSPALDMVEIVGKLRPASCLRRPPWPHEGTFLHVGRSLPTRSAFSANCSDRMSRAPSSAALVSAPLQ